MSEIRRNMATKIYFNSRPHFRAVYLFLLPRVFLYIIFNPRLSKYRLFKDTISPMLLEMYICTNNRMVTNYNALLRLCSMNTTAEHKTLSWADYYCIVCIVFVIPFHLICITFQKLTNVPATHVEIMQHVMRCWTCTPVNVPLDLPAPIVKQVILNSRNWRMCQQPMSK